MPDTIRPFSAAAPRRQAMNLPALKPSQNANSVADRKSTRVRGSALKRMTETSSG